MFSVSWWDTIVDFMGFMEYFMFTDLVILIESAMKYWVKQFIYASVQFSLWSVPFMWDIAKEILVEINISTYLQSAWASIDGLAAQLIVLFKVPDAVNVIMTAFVTKFGLRVMGW